MELTQGEINDSTPKKQNEAIKLTPTKNNEKLCRICL
jgi:hypothetical protein